jgi:hypothetical protein
MQTQHVEMWVHKIGFVPPHEALATHQRRRYRVRPMVNDGSMPQTDPNLWIVHYSRADIEDHLPANRIQFSPAIQQLLHRRRVLQQQGQLVRKEFMLHDRANWPHVQLPQGIPPQYAGEVPPRMAHVTRPQQYIGGPDPTGPSPAKRQRQSSSMQRPSSSKMPSATNIRDSAMEEEQEDQDLFDLLTPRDISSMRFTKHHEWMEEVFSSPWDTLLIDPVPLGQGRKGALVDVTVNILDAPTEESIRTGPGQIAKAIGSEKMTELTTRVRARIAADQKEKERMLEEHARQMANVRKGSIWRDAERALRVAPSSHDAKDDPFKLESGFRNPQAVKGDFANMTVDKIVQKVNEQTGRTIVPLDDSKCVDKGGLQEQAVPEAEPVQEDTEMELGDSTTFAAFTTGIDDSSEAHPSAQGSALQNTGTTNTATAAQSIQPPSMPQPKPTAEQSGGDWVMVDKSEAQPPTAAPQSIPPPSAPAAPNGPASALVAVPSTAPSAPADLGSDLVNFNEPTPEGGDFGGGEFDDQIDFGNIDTAGEALAGFDGNGGAGGMEDSAFGDAFHHNDAGASGGQGHPQQG